MEEYSSLNSTKVRGCLRSISRVFQRH